MGKLEVKVTKRWLGLEGGEILNFVLARVQFEGLIFL